MKSFAKIVFPLEGNFYFYHIPIIIFQHYLFTRSFQLFSFVYQKLHSALVIILISNKFGHSLKIFAVLSKFYNGATQF